MASTLLLNLSAIIKEKCMDKSKANKFKKLLIQEKNRIINSMKTKELEKLKAIQEALGRLEQGAYGYCEECDESIGENRLKMQPWTTLCLSDAEELERQLQKQIYI